MKTRYFLPRLSETGSNMDFPENFEPEIYRSNYKFSKDISDNRVLEHYETSGKEQRLIPSRLKSR
jgi:hypothetical protein